jgi:hypothetical protein
VLRFDWAEVARRTRELYKSLATDAAMRSASSPGLR